MLKESQLLANPVADSKTQVFELPNLEQPIYSLENLNLLPPFLGHDFHFRRTANREKLVEIVVTDLGDASYSEYSMIVCFPRQLWAHFFWALAPDRLYWLPGS